MRREGRAEAISGSGGGSGLGGGIGSISNLAGGGGKEGTGDVFWIYWRTPEEWAEMVEAWVEETAQKNSVLTLYELTEGEGTKGTGKLSFHNYVNPEFRDGVLINPFKSQNSTASTPISFKKRSKSS